MAALAAAGHRGESERLERVQEEQTNAEDRMNIMHFETEPLQNCDRTDFDLLKRS